MGRRSSGLVEGALAGALGGALAAFVAFWLLVLGGFVGGPRPSPSPWTWAGVVYAQLYLLVFALIGAGIGGVLGLVPGLVASAAIHDQPSSRQRRILSLLCGLLGMVAMLVFERLLNVEGGWLTTAFALGGLSGGLVGSYAWLRLWARRHPVGTAEPV